MADDHNNPCATCNHDRDAHSRSTKDTDAACTECHCAEYAVEHPQGKAPFSERYSPEAEKESQAQTETEKKNAEEQSPEQPQ